MQIFSGPRSRHVSRYPRLHVGAVAAIVVALAGCQRSASGSFGEGGGETERVDCQVDGATVFSKVCGVERTAGRDGLVLTLHHPDGGFRRLDVTKDGRGVVSADGAQPAAVSIAGDKVIEVAVGSDRYRLPATVKGEAAAKR